jgi:hypothetical protein
MVSVEVCSHINVDDVPLTQRPAGHIIQTLAHRIACVTSAWQRCWSTGPLADACNFQLGLKRMPFLCRMLATCYHTAVLLLQ